MSLRRQGRMIAATRVPRKVIAITAVASRYAAAKPNTFHANNALTMIDGITMSRRDPYGTRRLAEMLAAHDGSTRSNAAAKMTRVDERNRVPAQPKNHRPRTMISRAWKRWLLTRNPANITGYGQIGTGGATAPWTANKLFQ